MWNLTGQEIPARNRFYHIRLDISQMSKNKENKHLAKTTLLARGWTEKTIKSLLSPPVPTQNPHYRKASPMLLWLETEVLVQEQTEEFKAAKAQKERRSAAAKRSCQTRQQKLLDYVAGIKFTVRFFDKATLKAITIRSKEEWHSYRGDWDFDASTADDLTLQRWMVNFLRHNATDYESCIDDLFGMVGKQAAYELLKYNVLDEIAEKYPYLSVECRRQQL